METLKVLILAGGHSTRMGSAKHLLSLDDEPLYLRLVQAIHDALPNVETHHISLANRSETDGALDKGFTHVTSKDGAADRVVKLQQIADESSQDIGPAAGLLAGYSYDPLAMWLIIACDYPLLEAGAITQLVQNYEEPATCFRNEQGFSEPLLAIWSPGSLEVLRRNVEIGRTGPSFTLKSLKNKLLVPAREQWLTNVNTPEEWETAKTRIEERQSSLGV